MKRFPLQPLDAEERALLAALPRLHGRAQPGEGVDARILAAARETTPAVAVERAPRRWLAPLGVAASLVVAAGLVWQQLPPAAAPTAQQEIATGAPDVVIDATTPQGGTAAAPEQRAVAPQPRPPAVVSAPVAATAEKQRDAARVAPPAPPAPPPASMESPAAAPALSPPPADAAAPRAASESTQSAPARESAPLEAIARSAVPTATTQPQPAARASHEVPVADDDVPPATVDAPGVRDAWLRRIAELVAEGRADEARESLAVFRERYPDAVLPPELQALEPPPPGE